LGWRKCGTQKHWCVWDKPSDRETLRDLQDRLVAIAQERKVIQGRRMRVDTTVVESNIHYPTDSGLLNDGARVFDAAMKKIEQRSGGLKKRIRDRKRSVTKRVYLPLPGSRTMGPVP
jgi:IS5 family transposase